MSQDILEDFVEFVCLLKVKEMEQHLKHYIKQILGFYFFLLKAFLDIIRRFHFWF